MFGFFKKMRRKEKVLIAEIDEKLAKLKQSHRRTIKHKYLYISLIGLATVFSGTFIYVYNGIQNNIDPMLKSTTVIMNAMEDATTLCQTTKVDNPLMEYFLADKSYTIHRDIRDNLTTIINNRELLGRNISYQTYLDSADIVCFANAIFVSGIQLCNNPSLIKPIPKMDAWRKIVVARILADKEYHQQIWVALTVDYVNYLLSTISRKKAKYLGAYPEPSKCDVQKVSKYIDSLP